jgi:hypothetical protein
LPVLVIGAFGARVGIVTTEAILPTLVVGFSLGILALGLGIYALTDIWNSGAGGARAAIFGMVYAAPVIAILGLISAAAVVYPRLTDISTDTEDPPLFVESGAGESRYDSTAAALQRAAYPAVTTRIYDSPPGEVYAAARNLFDKRGWAIRHSVEPAPAAPPLPDGTPVAAAEGVAAQLPETAGSMASPPDERGSGAALSRPKDVASLEATAETPIFRFRDDVAVRIESLPEGTRVDMRSASGLGEHDLGQNARRIRAFLADLDAILRPETPPAPGGAAAGR